MAGVKKPERVRKEMSLFLIRNCQRRRNKEPNCSVTKWRNVSHCPSSLACFMKFHEELRAQTS